MVAKASGASSQTKRKRVGSSTHAASGSTPERIAEAAYDLLRTGGVTAFSLRAVAKRAHVRLATVQHHFPTITALAQAVIQLNRRKYREAYERASALAQTPHERLTAIISFNLQDIQSSETRRFFIHFWSLLESIDGYSGDLLAALYAPQFEMLAAHIADLDPELSHSEAATRAQLIGALIEGMFITLPPLGGGETARRQALDLCLSIADGTC